MGEVDKIFKRILEANNINDVNSDIDHVVSQGLFDAQGETLLTRAIKEKQVQLILHLVREKKDSLRKKNRQGESPSALIMAGNFDGIFEELLEEMDVKPKGMGLGFGRYGADY